MKFGKGVDPTFWGELGFARLTTSRLHPWVPAQLWRATNAQFETTATAAAIPFELSSTTDPALCGVAGDERLRMSNFG
jgi:hypothetical protein